MRQPATQDALDALVREGRVDAQVGEDLKRDYRYLRRLEHRLQMIEDQQTHTIPDGIAHIACFMGYESAADFRDAVTRVLENVQGHYARLFESASELTSAQGNLVFTGVEEDPETLDTLSAMGFREAAHVSAVIGKRLLNQFCLKLGRHFSCRAKEEREPFCRCDGFFWQKQKEVRWIGP